MCAAQFFRRPLYVPLLAHTRTLTNRATSTGDKCDLGMVQAFALMVSWKEPTDGTSGVKMAIAVRLGYQLGLHVKRTTPLPDDEERARRIADRERTWFVLSCGYTSTAALRFLVADNRLRQDQQRRLRPPAHDPARRAPGGTSNCGGADGSASRGRKRRTGSMAATCGTHAASRPPRSICPSYG